MAHARRTAVSFGRQSRISRWLASLLALLGATVLLAAGAAEEAKAFAWKDTCTFRLHNNTNASVRPYLYVPVVPNAINMAMYAAFGAGGVPQNAPDWSATGIPLTGGCTVSVYFSNPGDNVKCGAAAPTVGRNSFNCSGNADWRVYQDNDDIKGDVWFPAGSGPRPTETASSPAFETATNSSSPEPRHLVALRLRDLGLDHGWESATVLEDFGHIGELFHSEPVPSGCEGRNEIEPRSTDASAFTRREGDEVAGVNWALYDNARQARAMLKQAVGGHGIACLTDLLDSETRDVEVSSERVTGTRLVKGASLHRLEVETGSDGEEARTDYFDVVGLRRGSANAVVMFSSFGETSDPALQHKAVRAVANRLP